MPETVRLRDCVPVAVLLSVCIPGIVQLPETVELVVLDIVMLRVAEVVTLRLGVPDVLKLGPIEVVADGDGNH